MIETSGDVNGEVHPEHHIQLRSSEQTVEADELHAYGAGLQSISAVIGLRSFTNLRSLCLHGNRICVIEGLDGLRNLENLNLSSNRIIKMEGLSNLSQLRLLDLSSNAIEEIRGLDGLTSLVKLVLAHNRIQKLRGLAIQGGPGFTLEYLDLHNNKIHLLSELWFLAGCMNLQKLLLAQGEYANPVCGESLYVVTVVAVLPHLLSLDGRLLPPQDPNGSLNCLTSKMHCDTPFNLNADSFSYATRPFQSASYENRFSPNKVENLSSNLLIWQPELTCRAQPMGQSSCTQHMDNKVGMIEDTEFSKGSTFFRLQSDGVRQVTHGANGKEYRKRVKHASRKSNITNTPPKNVFLEGVQKASLEQVTHPSSVQMGHDLVGFYTKRNDPVPPDKQTSSIERFDCLNSIEARLKFLESLTLRCFNTLDIADDESLCSPHYLKERTVKREKDDFGKKPSEETVNTRIVVRAMRDANVGTCDSDNKMSIHWSVTGGAGPAEHLLSTKEPAYTQTGISAESNVETDSIEEHRRSHLAELEQKNDNCLEKQMEKCTGNQQETLIKTSTDHQRISQLEAELQEKNMEILKYREGITKMEEMMKTNGNLDSVLHHNPLLDIISTAKTEIASLKEALDAAKLAKQVAETSLRNIVIERNQLKQSLSKLTKCSSSKLQHLSAELEACRAREMANADEIKRLFSLLNIERKESRRQSEAKSFTVNKPIVLLQYDLEKGMIVFQQACHDGQQMGAIDDALTWTRLKEDNVQLLLPLQTKDFLKLKEEMENLTIQSKKAEKLARECEMLQKRLDEADNIADNMQKTVDSLKADNNKLFEENRSLSSTIPENNKLLEENKRLSSMLSENVQRLVSSEDAVRIKNKMLDSQNDTIRDLKSENAALKKSIVDKTVALETVEFNLKRQIQEENEKVNELQAELADQEIILSELEGKLQEEIRAKEEAEVLKLSLQKRLEEKDDMLRYVESKIDHAKELYESREKSLVIERDKALENLQHAIRDKTAVQSQYELLIAEKKALEEKEQKLTESLEKKCEESMELSKKLSTATASLNAHAVAQEKLKDVYSSKVNQLCKVLEELQDASLC